MTSVQGFGLELCFTSGAGVVVYLGKGKTRAYVGAGASQKGSSPVWAVSVGRKALMLRKSQLRSEPC